MNKEIVTGNLTAEATRKNTISRNIPRRKRYSQHSQRMM